jgi:hypothetical protein
MASKEDDRDSQEVKFLELLRALRFADRYYEICAAHPGPGVELPPATQEAVLAERGERWKYDKRERFFAFREPAGVAWQELGLNVILRDGMLECILVFATRHGHIGDVFHGMAADVKQREVPDYEHDPPYPCPFFRDEAGLRSALSDCRELYQQIKTAIRNESW